MNPTLPNSEFAGSGVADPGMAALAQLAFGASTPAATMVAGGSSVFLRPASTAVDVLDLDLSDPDQCQFGDYTLQRKLGQGGMGVVYQAHQHSLDRPVALKLLAAGPWASAGFIERFRLEAQSAARMQHPNIVTIHEIGEHDGLPFFSMRLVTGESLAEKIRRDGALTPRQAAEMMRVIAEAVDYAHRLGVLHLDLKPGNVLLDESAQPLVADFGLARRLEEILAGDLGEVAGTPSYMAPEQAAGDGRLGIGTDVYALGATLFEALTARPPFRGATARETLEQVIAMPAPVPRSLDSRIPLDLQAICLKCLHKDPARRYLGAGALADDLRNFLQGREVAARRLNRWQRGLRLVRREPRLSALVALFVLSLMTGLLATTVQWSRADASATTARASLWRERAQTAETALADGNGFQGLPALVENLAEMEAAGDLRAAMLERQRIGTLMANAPKLIERIPVAADRVVSSVALSPDGSRVAIASHSSRGKRSVQQFDLASGQSSWETSTDGLTRSLVISDGMPHGMLRYTADGRHLLVNLLQMAVFAAPATADQILIDAADGRIVQPPDLAPGHSDIVYSELGERAIVRSRSSPSLRFSDRYRFYEVDGWRPVGPEYSDSASMWLFAPGAEWLLRTEDFQHFEAVDFGTLAPRWSLSLDDDRLVRAWRFAPDGQTLALGTLGGGVLLVDSRDGNMTALTSSPVDTVRWLEFDRQGQTLAALSESGLLMAWDLATRRPRSAPIQAPIFAREGRVRLLDGQLALSQGSAIAVYTLPPPAPFDNRIVPMPARILGRRPFMANAFDFDPAQRLLASGGSEGAVSIWRLPDPVLRPEHAAPLAPGRQVFDGRRLVAVAGDTVRLVDIADGRTLAPPLQHPQNIGFAELSADGRWLVTIAGRTVRIFDAASSEPHGEALVLPSTPLGAELAQAAPVLVLRTGANEDGHFIERVQVVDLDVARLRPSAAALPPTTGVFELDPLGRYVLAASVAGQALNLIDLGGAPDCPTMSAAKVNTIDSATISNDGAVAWVHYSAGSRRAMLVRWDLERCSTTQVDERQHLGLASTLLALGNGVIAHRHLGDALGIYGPEGLRERVATLPSAETLPQLALSRDGRRAALATRRAVQLYDLANGERLSALLTAPLGGNDGILRLAFSPDGNHLVGRTIVGHWLSWPLPSTELELAPLSRLASVLNPAAAERELSADDLATLRAELRAAVSAGAARQQEPPAARRLGTPAQAEPDPRFVPLDLGPAYNVPTDEPWPRMSAQSGELISLALGIQRLGGIDWLIKGGVQLSGGGPAVSLHPTRPHSDWIAVPEVRARRLHVLMMLHIPLRPNAPPRRAGLVEVREIDGREYRLEIMTMRDVVTTWQPELAAPSAKVAWIGAMPSGLRAGEDGKFGAHVYAVTLELPAGAAAISALRLGIGDGPMEAPLYYALTLESAVPNDPTSMKGELP